VHTTTRAAEIGTDHDVIIIGTGFSGLALGTALARRGQRSFLMLERAASVGGTWRDNIYPGAACDIQSHLYSYSFRPNPNWSRVYATQPEILAYLEQTAAHENLLPRTVFESEVTAADWDARRARWVVESATGRYTARALVAATGHLADPKMPDIRGLDTFRGELFHSARWDPAADWTGKRVGVIGTGASAIQIVPELVKTASQVVVFQRSAPYVIPRHDHDYSDAERRMFARLPETAQALRDDLFWGNESRFPQRLGTADFVAAVEATALDHLRAQVVDASLRERLTPDYRIGCKRILISNEYYPALTRSNASAVNDGIARIEQGGVRRRNGELVELDLIVVATGFEATDLPIAHRIRGRDGRLLADDWTEGGRAFACATVHGYPNLFVMLGPNTGLGAGSIIQMVESQTNYIEGAVNYISDNDVPLEPTLEAEEEFLSDLHRRAEETVWVNGGCSSWYVHPKSGRLTALWPDFMHRFRDENGHFDPGPYVTSPAVAGL
jgi:cation diffusion facilitator CzcD-associated flavoprotein CzcO